MHLQPSADAEQTQAPRSWTPSPQLRELHKPPPFIDHLVCGIHLEQQEVDLDGRGVVQMEGGGKVFTQRPTCGGRAGDLSYEQQGSKVRIRVTINRDCLAPCLHRML